MQQSSTNTRIENMLNTIKSEAEEEAKKIEKEARNRAQKLKMKRVNENRDRIDIVFEKRKEAFKVKQRLDKSKKINSTRLQVQSNRNDLLNELKGETKVLLEDKMGSKSEYKKVLRSLILQGLIRLLERNVKVRVLKEDQGMVKDMLSDIKSEFTRFIKKELQKEITINLEVDKKRFLKKEDMGGCILICGKGKIFLKNTLAMRLDLAFEDSKPQIRKHMFPSLQNRTL